MQNLFLFNSVKGGTLLFQVLHGGTGTKAGGVHENNSFLLFVAVGSFTADSNLLQPTGCKQYTSHVTLSPTQRTRLMMCVTTLAQVLVRVIPSMCHAPE